MDDMSDALALLETGTYEVTRPGPTVLAGGRKGTPDPTGETFEISAVEHPLTGADLKRMPEGLRLEAARVLYTTTQLFAADDDGREPDRVTIDGHQWPVVQSAPWAPAGNYYRVIVARPPT